MTSSSHTSLRRLQAFQRAYRNDRARVLVLPLLRDGSVPGRRSSGLVRSLRRRGARGAEVPCRRLVRARRTFGFYRNTVYSILSCITPSLNISTALVASTHRASYTPPRLTRGGHLACGAPPAGSRLAEAERSSIRTRNGPVLLKTKSPKCSLCRRMAGSFERKRSLEPGDQRRRRSVRAFPFC